MPITKPARSVVLSYVYSKQPILGLTQEWFRELSFSRLERGVHDKLHTPCVRSFTSPGIDARENWGQQLLVLYCIFS